MMTPPIYLRGAVGTLAIAALTLGAHAQVRPGDVLVRSNPTGNTVSIHRPDGTLVARADGTQSEWRLGVAITPDFGWVTFRFDNSTAPSGWRMMRYDTSGVLLGESNAGEISEVTQFGVDRTSEGVILVADPTQERVHKYAANGTFLGSVDIAPLGISPHLICPTDDGGFWVFEDGQLAGSPAEGRKLDSSGQVAGSVTFAYYVQDVELAPDGTFWATRYGDSTIRNLDTSGAVLGSFNFVLGTGPSGLQTPNGVAVQSDGTLWVTVLHSTIVTHLSSSGQVLGSFNAPVDLAAFEVRVVREGDPIGTAYCSGVPNQTGQVGALGAYGSAVVVDDGLRLRATSLPQHQLGFFIASRQPGFVPAAGGSAGNLCLSGAIGRFVGPGQVMTSGASGTLELEVDLLHAPTPSGPVSILSGERWYFQCWHQDTLQGMPTGNFTLGLEVDFL